MRLRSEANLDAWLGERDLTHEEILATLRERDLEQQALAYARSTGPCETPLDDPYRAIVALLEARTGLSEAELTCPLLMGPGLSWNDPLLRELKLRGEYRAAQERAAQIVQFVETCGQRRPDLTPTRLNREAVERWCADLWGVDTAGMREACYERGFAGPRELTTVARPAYLYASLGPAP